MVDAEGYTIPPPDRAVWPGDAAVASLIDDDFSSDNARYIFKTKCFIDNPTHRKIFYAFKARLATSNDSK